MQTTTINPEFVEQERVKSNRDYSGLNGNSEEAKLIIRVSPIKDDEGMFKYLAQTGNGKFGSTFASIPLQHHKNILYNMNDEYVLNYLKAKNETDRITVIEKGETFLSLIHEGREYLVRIKEKKEVAKKVIKGANATLDNITDLDKKLSAALRVKIKSLKDEIEKTIPVESIVDTLSAEVQKDAEDIIGEEKVASARQYGSSVIKFFQSTVKKGKVLQNELPIFEAQITALETIMKGTDILLIESMAAQISKDLIEMTDENLRAEKRSITGATRNIMRILLKNFFNIAEFENFDQIVYNIISVHIKQNYTVYLSNRGRIAMKLPALSTFVDVEKGAMAIILGEIILVHEGDEKIDNVIDNMSHLFTLPNLDMELRDLQKKVLNITDLYEAPRLEAIKEKLLKVKEAIIAQAINMSGFNETEARDLTNGKLFSDALKMIPGFICEEFRIFQETEEKPGEEKEQNA